MILLIDNYDSFAFNLQRYLVRLGQEVMVVRNDDQRLVQAIDSQTTSMAAPLLEIRKNFRAIVLSPGPKRPSDAGSGIPLVQSLSGLIPILGVCLGHQIICEAFGAKIVRAKRPVHGLATPITIENSQLFDGLSPSSDGDDPIDAETTVDFARYHSLVAEAKSLPNCLKVTAWSQDDQIMAVEHRQHATFGIQFHPESILTTHGYSLLRNFLAIANCQIPTALPTGDLVDERLLLSWQPTKQVDLTDMAAPAVAHPTLFGRQ